jgi:DNA-binding NarL/FixJ family response regulator
VPCEQGVPNGVPTPARVGYDYFWRMSNARNNGDSYLTERQIEILLLIAEGLQNKEIAERLTITDKAVEFHKTRLYARIGVTNIAGAVRYAIREGYVDA